MEEKRYTQYELLDMWTDIITGMIDLPRMEPDLESFCLGRKMAYSFATNVLFEPALSGLSDSLKLEMVEQKTRERIQYHREKQEELSRQGEIVRANAQGICIQTLENVVLPILPNVHFE